MDKNLTISPYALLGYLNAVPLRPDRVDLIQVEQLLAALSKNGVGNSPFLLSPIQAAAIGLKEGDYHLLGISKQ